MSTPRNDTLDEETGYRIAEGDGERETTGFESAMPDTGAGDDDDAAAAARDDDAAAAEQGKPAQSVSNDVARDVEPKRRLRA